MNKLLVWVLITWAGLGQALAQKNLSGKIVDQQTGEPLPFVNVVIAANSKGTSTNVDGFFTLLNIPSDTSTILISYLGYGVKKVQLNAQNFDGITQFEISKQAVELKAFEITDRKNQTFEIPNQVSKVSLNPAQIMNLPNLGEVDIFRSLQLLPGVSGSTESSSGLYVRGGTPDQNLVLLDGINVYHVDHFFGVFSPFNAFAIKDVQFYKGGFPAEFGGRLSSVVDITAKTGNSKKLSAGVNANLLSINGVIEAPLPKKWGSILVAGRRSYTDVLQSPTYTALFNNVSEQENQDDLGFGIGDFAQINPVFFFYDFNAKATLTPSNQDVITLSVFSSKDKLDNSSTNNFGGFIGGNSRLQTIDITNWGNTGYSAKWSRQFSPKLYGKAILSYSNYASDYELTNNFITEDSLGNDTTLFSFKTIQDNEVEDITFRYDAEWQWNENNLLKAGVWYTYNQINYLNVLDDTVELQNRFETANNYATYLQNETTIGKLTANYGLRSNFYSKTNKWYFEPRLSFSYNVFSNIKIKGAWGIYRQFVNRVILENVFGGSRDFWLLSDGNTLPVSISQHYILGLTYEPKNWLFDVEAYQKNLSGLLEYTLRFGGFDADNENFNNLFYRGTGVVQGIDFLLQRTFGKFTGWLGYTLSKVTYNFPELNQSKNFPALQDQRHETKLVTTYSLKTFDFSFSFVYATGKPFTAPVGLYNLTLIDGTSREFIHFGDKNSQRLPDYHRADFSVTYKYQVKKVKGTAGVSFFNIYNRKNIRYKRYFLRTFNPETLQTIRPEIVETDITLLGFVPNIFITLNF